MPLLSITRKRSTPFTFSSDIEASDIEINESSTGRTTRIRGTLLSEGISRNGNYYSIPEMDKIASQAEGLLIRFGTETRINPNSGLLTANMHKLNGQVVGRILFAYLDKAKRKIIFEALIDHPNFINLVKKGWKVSIDGKAKVEYLIERGTNRIIAKVKDMVLRAIQLLSPDTPSGVPDALIENTIEESLVFGSDLTKRELGIIIASLKLKGFI